MVKLIDSDTGTWNYDLIRGLFVEADVSKILFIPLSLTQLEDQRRWCLAKDRVYTVSKWL